MVVRLETVRRLVRRLESLGVGSVLRVALKA
jgi:hypothetical protein